jgi:hypothetical protein
MLLRGGGVVPDENRVHVVIPRDWQARPGLLPALRVWVEGARRVLALEQQDRKPT